MAPLIFEIIADFKMQGARAVIESNKIQGALDAVSGSAERALGAVSSLGVGIAQNFGVLSGIGALGKSVQIAEKFQQTVTNIASIITSNLSVFEGNFFDSFNNRILISQKLVRELAAEASRLGVRESTLLSTFKSIGFIGLQGGLQIEEIKRLSANVQLAAPVVGLDPAQVGDQLFRLGLQGAGGSPRLFKTLLADTQTFARFKKTGGVREFGKLSIEERVQLIAKAFEEFGNKPEILARQLNSLSSQMNILSNQVNGVSGVLKPIGDVLFPVVLQGLKQLIGLIETSLRPVLMRVSEIIKNLRDSPIEMFKDLLQLSKLKGDVGLISGFFSLAPKILFISTGFSVLSFVMAGMNGRIARLVHSLGRLGSLFSRLTNWALISNPLFEGLTFTLFMGASKLGKFWFVLRGIMNAMGKFTSIMLVLTIIVQTISRAFVEFKVGIAEFFVKNAARIAQASKRLEAAFQKLWSPFQGFIENVGSLLGNTAAAEGFLNFLLSLTEMFATLAEGAAKLIVRFEAFVAFVASIAGSVFVVIEQMFGSFLDFVIAIFALMQGNPIPLIQKTAGGDISGLSGGLKMIEDALVTSGKHITDSPFFSGEAKPGEEPVTPAVTHTGDVIINNDIKEAFEPDRIAFTITEQIKKALISPVTAAGNSNRRTGQQVE